MSDQNYEHYQYCSKQLAENAPDILTDSKGNQLYSHLNEAVLANIVVSIFCRLSGLSEDLARKDITSGIRQDGLLLEDQLRRAIAYGEHKLGHAFVMELYRQTSESVHNYKNPPAFSE